MENTPLPQKPVLIDEPPTAEYVDPKKDRKRIIKIIALVVIISIPIVVSLFKIDYSVNRAYEIVNPSYIGISPNYQAWGSLVTTARKIIQPVIHLPEKENVQVQTEPTAAPTMVPRSTPTPTPNYTPTPTPSPAYVIRSFEIPTLTPTLSPTITPTPKPTRTPTPSPTITPTITPTPTIYQAPNPDNDKIDAYAAYTACYTRPLNYPCLYHSAYGGDVSGYCKMSTGGTLMCLAN